MNIFTARTLKRRHALKRRRASRRAVELIEFTLLLPLTIFFMIFILNMGSLMLTNGVLHDAAYTAANSAAQLGTLGNGSTSTSGQPWNDANNTLKNIGPGYSAANLSVVSAGVVQANGGSYNGNSTSQVCTAQNNGNFTIVKVTLSYNAPLLPGMAFLLSMASQGHSTLSVGNTFALQATGVARCEIAR